MLQQGIASQDFPKEARLKEEEEQSLLLVHGIVDNENPSVAQERAAPWIDSRHLWMILQCTAGMVMLQPEHVLQTWHIPALGNECTNRAGVPNKIIMLLQDLMEGLPDCCR